MSNPSTAVVLASPSVLKSELDKPAFKARLSEVLDKRAPQFAAALVQVVARSRSLQGCTAQSVIGAAITAAALDLSLDGNLGEAHLVPYGSLCQFQIGYKGLTQLGLRSGQYKRLGWAVVHEGELIEVNTLMGEVRIDPTQRKSDTVIGYAAALVLLNGFTHAEFWTVERVEEHAARYSQAFRAKKKDSPWFTNFDVMALKTVLKDLLSHWGPKSVTMQMALTKDQAVFRGIGEASYDDNVLGVEGDAPTFGTDDPAGSGAGANSQGGQGTDISGPTGTAPAGLKGSGQPVAAPELKQRKPRAPKQEPPATTPAQGPATSGEPESFEGATQAQPASAAATPPPGGWPQAEAPLTAKARVAAFLDQHAITFEDFCDWLQNAGVMQDASTLGTVEDLPEVAAAIITDGDNRMLKKCATIYGKK